MPVLASHNEPLNPQCSHCICTNGSERASPLLSRATPNPFSSAQSYRKESRMPGCSRKHIFHPHNIYSSAGLYRFKAGAPNETENLLSRRDRRTEIREILCVGSTREEQKISLIVETLPYWIVASPLIHHHHAPHFCQNISKVTSQRPIFSYFHFSLLPFVLANNNNTLFFLDYFLFHTV